MPKISAERQITLPVDQCREVGIGPGDEYRSFVAGGCLLSRRDPSSEHQALAPGLRDRIAEFPRGVDPERHRFLDVLERGILRVAMGHAPRKLGHFSHEGIVRVAPIEDYLVFVHQTDWSPAYSVEHTLGAERWIIGLARVAGG